ncbi:MAG: hypothetical protein AABY53_06710 [Bdellovibrionota bacterium]
MTPFYGGLLESEKLTTRKFKPRTDLEKSANELIDKELEKLPIDGKLRTTIVDEGVSFSISMVAIVKNRLFSSESHHRKDLLVGADRYWQLDKIKLVLADLIYQIKKSFKL